MSEDLKLHDSYSKKPGKPPSHPLVKNLETGDIFGTYTEAAKAIDGDRTNVKRVACGVQSHHKGYHFEFVDQ
jgi:hypothetical protein